VKRHQLISLQFTANVSIRDTIAPAPFAYKLLWIKALPQMYWNRLDKKLPASLKAAHQSTVLKVSRISW